MKRLLVSAAVLFSCLTLIVAAALPPPEAAAAPAVSAASKRPGIVVLFRGGANIFSTGMDEIADKLRAKGVNARSEGHASWTRVTAEVREAYRKRRQPIIFVGHSFGANAALLAARELGKENIPVPLVILYDPTAALRAPANVRKLINYYSSTFSDLGLEVKPGSGFNGTLQNIGHPDIGHLDIDNDVRLHDKSIQEILRALRGRASAALD